MITFDDLNTQNHHITELTNVLSFLLADRSMCDTAICCELFFRYSTAVQEHLDLVDHTYTALLASPDNKINNVARKFMGGSQEIRRIFSHYTKQWCSKRRQQLNIKNHGDFYAETTNVFEMVLKRIQDETEHLYPMIREVSGDAQRAA